MADLIRKQLTAECKVVDAANAVVDAVVSTIAPDLDGEVMLPSAWVARLPKYKRNPLHIWQHGGRSLRDYLGKAVDVNVDERGLVARFKYAVNVHEDARIAFGLVEDGSLNCFSVGFVAHKWIRPSEVATLPASDRAALASIDLSGVVRIYTDVTLKEISLVGRPANEEAFVIGRSAEEGNDEMSQPTKTESKPESVSAREKQMISPLLADCCVRLKTSASLMANCSDCRCCGVFGEWDGCHCGPECCCCANGVDCGACRCCKQDARVMAECCVVLTAVLKQCQKLSDAMQPPAGLAEAGEPSAPESVDSPMDMPEEKAAADPDPEPQKSEIDVMQMSVEDWLKMQ